MTRSNKRPLTRKVPHPRQRPLRPNLEHLEERTLPDATPMRAVIEVDWQGQQAQVFSNEWVIRFNAGSGTPAQQMQAVQAQLDTLSNLADFEAVQHLGSDGLFLVRGPEEGSYTNHSLLLQQLGAVAAIEPNFLITAQFVPDDTHFEEQWALRNTGQTIQGQAGIRTKDIGATDAWDISRGGSPGTIVAVLDTGIDYTHPDLNDNIFVNTGEIAGNSIDDDNNGFVDDVRGWDFANSDNDPMDTDGHGTHVAGIISAEGNNNQGIAGVAFGVKLLAVKFFNSAGEGSTAGAIAAVNYVNALRDKGFNIQVSTSSWGTTAASAELEAAISGHQSRGILYVAAAGNTSSDNDATPFYPASYTNDHIISVAATDNRDNAATFTSFGKTSVDLAAPGVNILSTLPGGGYGYKSGTSMAAAHVAGAAAFLRSLDPLSSYQQIRNAILRSTEEANAVGPSSNRPVATGGRLNVGEALNELGPRPVVVVDAPDPTASEAAGGSDTLTFTIRRAGAVSEAVTVQYTLTGSATNGTDYAAIPTSVTIPAGQSTATIMVSPINDTEIEGNETVELTLTGNGNYLIGVPDSATATIIDDDAATVTVAATDPNAVENSDDTGTFTFTRNGGTSGSLTVQFTVGGTATSGADYTALPTSVIIPAGQTSVTVTVSPLNDTLPEPSETVVLTLAPGGYVIGGTGAATVIIGDDDTINFPPDLQSIPDRVIPPSQQVISVPLSVTDPNGDPVNFTATAQSLASVLSQQAGQFVYSANFDNWGGRNEKWFLASGQWYFLLDSGELFRWDGGSGANGTSVGVVGSGYYTNPSQLENPTNDPHVTLAIAGNTLTITRDTAWGSTTLVTVTASDGRASDTETFTVFVTTATLPTVTVAATDANAGEPADPGTFTITRTGPTTEALTVFLNVDGTATSGTDYTALPTSVTIPAGASSVTLTVNPIDDSVYEGNETVVLKLAPGNYLTDAAKTATVTIAENDTRPPEIQPIASQTIPSSQQVVTVNLSVSDADGDPVTVTATAQSLAYLLSQQAGQFVYSSTYDNWGGRNEKWFLASGQWYFLLDSGELFRWAGGSGANGTSVGLIGASYYQDPSRLQNAAANDPHATLVLSGNTLTITRDTAWLSTIVVTVTADDGNGGTDTETFSVFVTP